MCSFTYLEQNISKHLRQIQFSEVSPHCLQGFETKVEREATLGREFEVLEGWEVLGETVGTVLDWEY